jgi:hypothetical protein
MPELPDLSVYIETIGAKTIGDPLEHVRLASPFLFGRSTCRCGRWRGSSPGAWAAAD